MYRNIYCRVLFIPQAVVDWAVANRVYGLSELEPVADAIGCAVAFSRKLRADGYSDIEAVSDTSASIRSIIKSLEPSFSAWGGRGGTWLKVGCTLNKAASSAEIVSLKEYIAKQLSKIGIGRLSLTIDGVVVACLVVNMSTLTVCTKHKDMYAAHNLLTEEERKVMHA